MRPLARFSRSPLGLILLVAAVFIPTTLVLPTNPLAQSPLSVVEFDSFTFKKRRIEDRRGTTPLSKAKKKPQAASRA